MIIVTNNAALAGFNQWSLNGEAFSMERMKPAYTLREGRRYRLKFPQRQRRHPPSPGDFALALVGFVLLIGWRVPPLLVVILGALGGIALA